MLLKFIGLHILKNVSSEIVDTKGGNGRHRKRNNYSKSKNDI